MAAKNRKIRVIMGTNKPGITQVPEEGYSFPVAKARELVVTAEDAALFHKRAKRTSLDLHGRPITVERYTIDDLGETDQPAEPKFKQLGRKVMTLPKSDIEKQTEALIASNSATHEALRVLADALKAGRSK